MANWDTPKSTGEYIGEVISVHANSLRIRKGYAIHLHNGDGLTVGDEGFYVNAIDGDTIKVNKDLSSLHILSSTKIYRNYDPVFLRGLHFERHIPVDIVFTITKDGYRLTYTPLDSQLQPLSHDFQATHSPATNPQRACQTIEEQLTKLGDTIYTPHSFRMENLHPDQVVPFIPISQLNYFRRETLTSK